MDKKVTLKGDIVDIVMAHQDALGLSNFSEACRSLIVLGHRQFNGTQSIIQSTPEPAPAPAEPTGAIDDLSGLL